MRTSSIALIFLTASGPAFAADVCTTVSDAVKKVIITPVHIYSTRNSGLHPDQPTLSEAIYTGGASGTIFVRSHERWIHSTLNPATALQQEVENLADHKTSCRYLRDEVVNGDPAAVYAIHSVSEDVTEDGTIWLSKSRGLPLKDDVVIDVGGGASGKNHIVNRYEYSNVHPPDGVK